MSGAERVSETLEKLRHTCAELRGTVALSSVVALNVKLIRAGREWKSRCPFHDDRSPSFTIFANDSRFYCFGCGASGDVVAFVRRLHNLSTIEALRMLGKGDLPATYRHAASSECEHDRSEEALALWNSAGPVPGTEAAVYLRSRGLNIDPPEALRFARLQYGRTGPLHPVLLALVTRVDGRPTGVQRTYLAAGGLRKLDVGKPRLSLGRLRGGAIRLAPVAGELILTEGLEDALSLVQATGRPAWAAAGAGMFDGVELPPSVSAITIGADNDAAGRESARKAAERFAANGLAARIAWPPCGHKDFNAALTAEQAL